MRDADQLDAEDVGTPGAGKEWIDSSLFFASTGSLLAIAATKDVSAADLQVFLTRALSGGRPPYLPQGDLVITDVAKASAIESLTGVRNLTLETVVDAFSLDNRPQLRAQSNAPLTLGYNTSDRSSDDSESVVSAEAQRPAAGRGEDTAEVSLVRQVDVTDVTWRGVREPVSEFIRSMLSQGRRPLGDFGSLVGDQRLRIKVQIFAEGSPHGVEHELANQLGAIARLAPDATSVIDLGKLGTISGEDLRIHTDLHVGQPYGATAINEIGSALAEWLAEAIAAYELNSVE